MDASRFTDARTGTLLEVQLPGFKESGVAFLPAPLPEALPEAWSMPEALWPFLVDAKQALGTLDGIGRTLPNPDLLMQPLQRREALRSSSLEGTYATPAELLLFEIEPREAQASGDRVNAWKEVANYRNALLDGYSFLLEQPLSLSLIKLLHHGLLSGVRGEEKSPGKFRDTQVYVGSDRRYVPPPALHLPGLLEDLESCMLEPSREIDPLVYSYLVHYQFEAIHPFTDGNGRVGRLLLALTTWKWCALSMPWLYMSAFFEKYRDEYIDRMFNISARGDWGAWIELCLRGTIEQCNDAIRRCEELNNLRRQMHERIQDASPRTHQQIENLFEVPAVTVPRVRDGFGISYPTAKSDINRLIKAGILVHLAETTHPAIYVSPEIMDIAFS